MLIIGVAGRAENGKSTVGKALAKEAVAQGLNAQTFELSEYVLRAAIGAGTIPEKTRAELTNEELQELVRLGAGKRTEDPDYWVKLLAEDIAQRKPDIAICPSLRFSNEADAIHHMGGIVVRVISYVVDGVEYISRTRDPNDVSEISQRHIVADYFLTTKRGESELLKLQAATLFRYLHTKKVN